MQLSPRSRNISGDDDLGGHVPHHQSPLGDALDISHSKDDDSNVPRRATLSAYTNCLSSPPRGRRDLACLRLGDVLSSSHIHQGWTTISLANSAGRRSRILCPRRGRRSRMSSAGRRSSLSIEGRTTFSHVPHRRQSTYRRGTASFLRRWIARSTQSASKMPTPLISAQSCAGKHGRLESHRDQSGERGLEGQ